MTQLVEFLGAACGGCLAGGRPPRGAPPQRISAVDLTQGMKGGKARWSGEGRYWRVVCVLLLSICLGVGAASWPAIVHEKQRASGGPEEPFLSVTPSLSVIKPAP